MDAPEYLLIGEAKHKSGFGRDGNLFLVHQLIRQYVLAKILMECWKVENKDKDSEKKVVTFIVGDNRKALLKVNQVNFMTKQEWLNPDNVLSWDCIDAIARGNKP